MGASFMTDSHHGTQSKGLLHSPGKADDDEAPDMADIFLMAA